jgi:hypothetical protein
VARVQLVLSTVSAEFRSYRDRLRHLLTRPDGEVKVQEDFIVTGDKTLEMLDTYIQGCDGVIHLVGDMTGAMAKPQSVAAIAARYPELASRLPLVDFLQSNGARRQFACVNAPAYFVDIGHLHLPPASGLLPAVQG